MALLMTNHLMAKFAQAAASAYPLECCGLMLGRIMSSSEPWSGEDGDRQIVDLVPADNRWDVSVQELTDPIRANHDSEPALLGQHRRYWIDPEMMFKVQRSARELNLDIIGVYHSHPEQSAIPSECDRRLAWPIYSYVIVSVKAGEITDCRSWRLDDQHRFQPESLKIVDKI